MQSTRTPCTMEAQAAGFGPTGPQRLLSDRRGAIVVVAVFMSMFLVGCLWYLIGIGETALYRERLDAASDASAFTGAVYHARGMNMVAMLNLIIAASLAIIVIAKTLKFVIGIVYKAALFSCSLAVKTGTNDNGSCATAQDAGSKLQLLSTVIDKVEAAGDGLLASLSTAQREIAVVTPWVAATESTNTAAKYEPIVKGGVAVSVAMVPSANRLGLPVMDENYEVTCNRGGVIAPELIQSMIPQAFLEYINGDPIQVAGGFSPEYCGPGQVIGADMDLFDEKDVCEKKKEEWKKKFKQDNGHWPSWEESKAFDWDKCIEDAKVDPKDEEKAQDEKNIPKENPANNLDKVDEPDKKTAKKLSPGTENGNDFFQVYALLEGDTDRLHKPDKGVQIAAGNQAQQIQADSLEGLGMSQAEFYYDQTATALGEDRCWKPNCGLKWDQYKENALWNLRWRARLRFFREPNAAVLAQGGGVNILTSGITGNAPVGVTESYIPKQIGMLNDAIAADAPSKALNQKLKILTDGILNAGN